MTKLPFMWFHFMFFLYTWSWYLLEVDQEYAKQLGRSHISGRYKA